MSNSFRPVGTSGNHQILTIDWKLLWRRLRMRTGQLFTSARHRAANTEYIPPAWMTRFRLTWFRIGLIALALFVLTQKQIDFTISVGKAGIATEGRAQNPAPADAPSATPPRAGTATPTGQTTTLSLLPTGQSGTAAAWDVNQYDAAAVRAYINRFQRVAKTEENKFSIPAAAKLAMAILGSNAGDSPAARENNNHFGGPTANGYYENAWSNWRAHSELIHREFPELAHESVNHQQWIAALARTGYTNDPQYGQKLLEVIARFGLDKV